MVEEDNYSQASSLCSDIESLLSDCEVDSCEWEEYAEQWKSLITSYQCDECGEDVVIENAAISELFHTGSINWGTNFHKEFSEVYCRSGEFSLTGSLPEPTCNSFSFEGDGSISKKGEELQISKYGEVFGKGLSTYFKDWKNPTEKEVMMLEMSTMQKYWPYYLKEKSNE